MIKLMKRLFTMFLCVFFPWVILLSNDNPGGAFVALVMQTTVIGWPFATAWAWRMNEENRKKTAKPKK